MNIEKEFVDSIIYEVSQFVKTWKVLSRKETFTEVCSGVNFHVNVTFKKYESSGVLVFK